MLSIFPFAIQKKETYLETENCIQEVCWGAPRGSMPMEGVVKGGRMGRQLCGPRSVLKTSNISITRELVIDENADSLPPLLDPQSQNLLFDKIPR